MKKNVFINYLVVPFKWTVHARQGADATCSGCSAL